MRSFVVVALLAACTSESDSDLAPTGPVEAGKGDGFCPTVPANIAPFALPQYSCGRLDARNAAMAADVNRFWGSNVTACECGPDFPEGCVGAWSLFGKGYIWIGVDFVNGLAESGSMMPAQYVFSHEFGHEITGRFGGTGPTTQQKELAADCLAGYYMGSLVCRGQVTERDVLVTLATAAIIADGTGDPIADLRTHGTAEQRATAVATGIRAYLASARPLDACAI